MRNFPGCAEPRGASSSPSPFSRIATSSSADLKAFETDQQQENAYAAQINRTEPHCREFLDQRVVGIDRIIDHGHPIIRLVARRSRADVLDKDNFHPGLRAEPDLGATRIIPTSAALKKLPYSDPMPSASFSNQLP